MPRPRRSSRCPAPANSRRQGVDRRLERPAGWAEQRGDVLEEDARLGEVGDVSDVLAEVHLGLGPGRSIESCPPDSTSIGPDSGDRNHNRSRRLPGATPTIHACWTARSPLRLMIGRRDHSRRGPIDRCNSRNHQGPDRRRCHGEPIRLGHDAAMRPRSSPSSGIPHESKVVSAHRTPDRLFEYGKIGRGPRPGSPDRRRRRLGAPPRDARRRSPCLPVLGVPVESKALRGVDSLLSIVQMPRRGFRSGRWRSGLPAPRMPALLAAAILAGKYPAIHGRRLNSISRGCRPMGVARVAVLIASKSAIVQAKIPWSRIGAGLHPSTPDRCWRADPVPGSVRSACHPGLRHDHYRPIAAYPFGTKQSKSSKTIHRFTWTSADFPFGAGSLRLHHWRWTSGPG